MSVAVLAYHSQNCNGSEYRDNDHVALKQDLKTIMNHGIPILPLGVVIDALRSNRYRDLPDKCISITCDDGTILDWVDYDHPQHGMQTSFARILREFLTEHNLDTRGMLTSFVIASVQARREIDQGCYGGLPLSDDWWWNEAVREGMITIGNHSFDHLHPELTSPLLDGEKPGDFASIDNYRLSRHQVTEAKKIIENQISVPGYSAGLFAYPCGQGSDYLKNIYFPLYYGEHGTDAAFTTEQAFITESSNIYALPRFVCGDAWSSELSFSALLKNFN